MWSLNNIILKVMRDQKKALFWWSFGMIAYNAIQMPFYPAMSSGQVDFSQLFGETPDPMITAFVGNVTDFGSPEGFLYSQYFFMMLPLLLMIYAIGLGAASIAKEEEQGTLEMIASYPLARWQIVLEKFGAMIACTMILHIVFYMQLCISMPMVDLEISFVKVWDAMLANYGLTVFFGSFALAVGAGSGKRSLSISLASAVAIGTYLINSLGLAVESVKPFRNYTPWYYMTEQDPLIKGLDPVHLAILLGGSLILLVVAIIGFENRDIGKG